MNTFLREGLTLMGIGMGAVFTFLIAMVIVMNGTAALFKRYAHLFPEDTPVEGHLSRIATDETVEVAIAVAAIEAYNH